jgi:hypothetical protein
MRLASPILSKKVIRLTKPPKGVIGFGVAANLTCHAGKAGLQNFDHRLVKEVGVRLFDTTLLPYDL